MLASICGTSLTSWHCILALWEKNFSYPRIELKSQIVDRIRMLKLALTLPTDISRLSLSPSHSLTVIHPLTHSLSYISLPFSKMAFLNHWRQSLSSSIFKATSLPIKISKMPKFFDQNPSPRFFLNESGLTTAKKRVDGQTNKRIFWVFIQQVNQLKVDAATKFLFDSTSNSWSEQKIWLDSYLTSLSDNECYFCLRPSA